MKGNIKKWTQRSINKTLIAFNSKFLYNFNLNVQIFKWSVTNDETISDQPTESLRELLLFGGTPLLFVENRAMHTFWSQIQQILLLTLNYLLFLSNEG